MYERFLTKDMYSITNYQNILIFTTNLKSFVFPWLLIIYLFVFHSCLFIQNCIFRLSVILTSFYVRISILCLSSFYESSSLTKLKGKLKNLVNFCFMRYAVVSLITLLYHVGMLIRGNYLLTSYSL